MTDSPFSLYNQFNIAVIDDSLANCICNFKQLLKDYTITLDTLTSVDFTAVCGTRDLEYNPTERRFLLYEPLTNPNTTILFSNLVDGWYTAVYNYTRLFHRDAFFPGFTANEGRFSPAYFFRHFKSNGDSVEERVVHLIKEDKWVFFEKSNPLNIENTENYQKRKSTDRLNNDIILGYLQKAGYDLTKASFYKTHKKSTLFTCD